MCFCITEILSRFSIAGSQLGPQYLPMCTNDAIKSFQVHFTMLLLVDDFRRFKMEMFFFVNLHSLNF